MLSIVGTRIYLHEGDNCSFRVQYKDSNSEVHNFISTDMLTMNIKDRETGELLAVKTSESINLNDEEASILTFSVYDAVSLPNGNYVYDLILDTVASRHLLIDNANLHVLKSNISDSAMKDKFIPMSLVSPSDNKGYLSTTSLICRFNHTPIKKEEVPGTLILFNKVNHSTDDDNDQEDEDTLIIFGDKKEDNTEDTLIIFGEDK